VRSSTIPWLPDNRQNPACMTLRMIFPNFRTDIFSPVRAPCHTLIFEASNCRRRKDFLIPCPCLLFNFVV
jgi:hypothetical protein